MGLLAKGYIKPVMFFCLRWFSKEWQTFMKKNEVPMEYRPLTRRPHGNVTGSLEMWVEMMDSQKAARVPRFNLQKPSSTDIEIRYEVCLLLAP